MITYGSVCSGIESASVAWEPLGMIANWFSEIEAFPSAVLAYHWSSVPNLGDMNLLPDMIRGGLVPAPDVLVGGTPCQAFSMAGLRAGLEDSRGQLTLTYVDILNAIDEQRKGREAVCVWENVPGVLSSKDNAFGCFLAALCGEDEELRPAGKKWTNAGVVFGPQRAVAWRILDAQYFGVAQRRRRVFVVASARDGFDPTKVLFESDGMRRDSPPSREAKTKATGGAGSRFAIPINSMTVQGRQSDDLKPRTGSGIGKETDAQNTLSTAHHHQVFTGHRMVAFGEYATDETASTMKARDYKDATDLVTHPIHDKTTRHAGKTGDKHAVCINSEVHRLTPIECERLQGFPDNHTQIPWRKKPVEDCPDGPRYKAIGNSKAVPVIRWVGKRLLKELS